MATTLIFTSTWTSNHLPMTTLNNTLTAVPGLRVGHMTDLEAITGCTVVICPPGTIGGVDQRGGAPGTRETDLLRPLHLVETVNAVVLSGGSAYGLAAADGVMRYLEENNLGYHSRAGFVVPIVPTAILMDLGIGRSDVRPDAAMGYRACEMAVADPVPLGCVGAGTGCRVGPMRGNAFATKGGIGSAAVTLENGVVIAALVAVNPVGDVLNEQGQIMAGLRAEDETEGRWANTLLTMRAMASAAPPDVDNHTPPASSSSESNTIIGVIATNAKLTKDQVNKVAQMGQDGVARAVRPAHTMFDGDTLFALATGAVPADVNLVGAYAAEMVAAAIRSGVQHAVTLGGVRAWNA